jgi:hypothetical protein
MPAKDERFIQYVKANRLAESIGSFEATLLTVYMKRTRDISQTGFNAQRRQITVLRNQKLGRMTDACNRVIVGMSAYAGFSQIQVTIGYRKSVIQLFLYLGTLRRLTHAIH